MSKPKEYRVCAFCGIRQHKSNLLRITLPDIFFDYAKSAEGKGYKVIIAGAGGAAHLPGMAAAIFPLPVIGVPIETKALGGVDSLY